MGRFFGSQANEAVDRFLYKFSVYGVPVVIGLASLAALFLFDNQYPLNGASPVEIRIAEDPASALTPAQAMAKLALRAPTQAHKTSLSESPFWFSFAVPANDLPVIVEFPSRHAIEAACWNAADFSPLGSASRTRESGGMREVKTGFALETARSALPTPVLCRATHTGPAYISALLWPAEQFHLSEMKFSRNSGLLDGGLIMLSLFVLLTAIVNRKWLYLLFAIWLVANLRLAAISGGWDPQWLERAISPEWLTPMRELTTAVYYTLTITLFSQLFADTLKHEKYLYLLRINQWSCPPLLVAALTLTYAHYLPLLWILTASASAVLVFLLARILIETRSKVAMWYAAGLAITLFSSLNEVVAAALGVRQLIGSVNSVTAALSSSLMAAIAIAEQMKQEHLEKVEAQTELRNTYDAIPIGLFTMSEEGDFLRGNPSLTDKLGIAPLPNSGSKWNDFFESGSWEALQDSLNLVGTVEMELRSLEKTHEDAKWYLVKATLAGKRIEGSLQDVTERHQATDRLRFLADHDPLTGVFNRRGIERVFESANLSLAGGGSMSLAYIDLDRFKLINDLFGHVAGDLVLKHVCLRIKANLLPGQALGRVGGDEFVVLFPEGPIDSAADQCRRIVADISSSPFEVGERAFQVGCGIGVVEIVKGTLEDEAVSLADRACREAKSGPKNNLVVYRQDMSVLTDHAEELKLIKRLDSTEHQGLFLMMQPIMSLRDPFGSLNFEVLLRMRNPDGGVIPPWKIITAAERNGRIAALDKWVLTSVLEWLGTHSVHLSNTSYVSVNLSGGSLNDERFIEDAFAIFAEYGPIVKRICIEITESVALHDLANTRTFIDGIRKFGAKLSLDDFGAGYTSFSYLRSLPADAIKIDGAYVKDLLNHPANHAIVRAIVDLALNLGMKCIAEWPEDIPTLEALAEMGVDYAQGYVISRPLMPERILLASSSADCVEDPRTARFIRESLAAIIGRADQVNRDWAH